jgi:hypothetical protein
MIKKTAILLAGVVLIISVMASGCTFNVGNVSPSPTSTTYASPKGYTIKYTSDWGKPDEQNNGRLVAFLTPTKNELENLNVEVNSWNGTLASLTNALKSDGQSLDNFKGIEATNTTLSGLPAYKLVFAGTDSGEQLKILQTFTVKDGKGYVITYKASPSNYDTYLSEAQQMIDSFQIT